MVSLWYLPSVPIEHKGAMKSPVSAANEKYLHTGTRSPDTCNSGFGSGNICEKGDVYHHALVNNFPEVIGWYQKSKPVVM